MNMHFMVAKGLRTHYLYNYAGYILSYVKIVYKPRNIPVQVKDGCRLLIKRIVFVEHFSVKENLIHGLYNSWKTFTLLYRPSTQSIHFAMMHLTRAVGYRHVCPTPTKTPQSSAMLFILYALLQKRWFSCQRNQHLRGISLIT